MTSLAALLSACAAGPTNESTEDVADEPVAAASQATENATEMALADLPLAAHRRAAQLVEDVRGGGPETGWAGAHIAGTVRLLKRPDIEGVAYYELAVEGPLGEPSGFIILSAGDHDFPISQYSEKGLPPSRRLDDVATATPAAYYQLDALAFAADDASGQVVAELGDQPVKILGLTPQALANEQPFEQTAFLDENGQLQLQESGTVTPSLSYAPWADFAEMKAEFAATYGPMLDSLRAQATEDWNGEAKFDAHGEALQEGLSRDVALLFTGATLTYSGAGAALAKPAVLTTAGGTEVLHVSAPEDLDGEYDVTVQVAYPNGLSEILKLTLIPAVPTPQWIGPWSPFTEFSAGTLDDQRNYGQLTAFEGPNDRGCLSGCGPTAWAMLFGWIDVRASQGDPVWAGRQGIFRQNGGGGCAAPNAPDAIAPDNMTAGVPQMLVDLRNYLFTFCVPGGLGATHPFTMWQSVFYTWCRAPIAIWSNGSNVGIHWPWLRDIAIANIDAGRPVIIGVGWLEHYPLAFRHRVRSRLVREWYWWGTQFQHDFGINDGAGDGGIFNTWIAASTWYTGIAFPN